MLARLTAPIFRLALGDPVIDDPHSRGHDERDENSMTVDDASDSPARGEPPSLGDTYEGAGGEWPTGTGSACLSCDIATYTDPEGKDPDCPPGMQRSVSSQTPEPFLDISSGPTLPTEILDQIFAHVDRQALVSIASSSHTFHGIATRLLYRHIPSLSLSQTVRCLRTLACSPTLASYALSYEIGDMDSLDVDRTRTLLPAFFRLLSNALHNMTRLTELSYLLFGPTSHVLIGAPFRLTKLTVSCDFDPDFARFLAEQSSLHTALFCGRYISGTSVEFSALPSLHRVSASPLILASVVAGRPVREVELCLVHPWLLNEDVLETTIQIISYSKGPLQSLQIISHLTGSADTILRALAVVPRGLSGLESLALHAVSGSITNELLSGLPPILAQFASLKSLILISKNQYDAVHDHVVTKTLASLWHAACASLECVSLPHGTWVRNRKYGWVTLQDLECILLEREQALMNRERRVREREEVLDLEQRSLIERERQLEDQIKELKIELGL